MLKLGTPIGGFQEALKSHQRIKKSYTLREMNKTYSKDLRISKLEVFEVIFHKILKVGSTLIGLYVRWMGCVSCRICNLPANSSSLGIGFLKFSNGLRGKLNHAKNLTSRKVTIIFIIF